MLVWSTFNASYSSKASVPRRPCRLVTTDKSARETVARAREAVTASNIRGLRLGPFEFKSPDGSEH
jgi:hypothetical protein